MRQGRLQGKTVLITAAAQGMGRACALACAAEGASVIATDIDAPQLASLVQECSSIQTELLDVRDGAAVQALAARLPALDVLFKANGHWRPDERPADWGDPEATLHQRQFWAVFEACLEHLPAGTARVEIHAHDEPHAHQS